MVVWRPTLQCGWQPHPETERRCVWISCAWLLNRKVIPGVITQNRVEKMKIKSARWKKHGFSTLIFVHFRKICAAFGEKEVAHDKKPQTQAEVHAQSLSNKRSPEQFRIFVFLKSWFLIRFFIQGCHCIVVIASPCAARATTHHNTAISRLLHCLLLPS